MTFVLDEASWEWDGADRALYTERIELLLDRLDIARERGETFSASSELLNQRIRGADTLNDLLWDQEKGLALPREVRERVAARFGALTFWDDNEEWPALEVTVANRTVVSPSAALAHKRAGQGVPTACIALPGNWSGPHEVVVCGLARLVHYVTDEATHRAFFRENALAGGEQTLVELSEHAFPSLLFTAGVWDGIRRFDGGYARVRARLHELLATLDDHGAWVFTDTTGRLSRDEPMAGTAKPVAITNAVIQARFGGCGLDVAPEKPNVYADLTCRRARECVVGGVTLYCEWHFKFEPHINRAHFHAPVPQSGNKVVVAFFRDHLPLP